jgi:alpha-glucosidase
VIEDVLGWAKDSGSASTWVLSNHDIVRPVSRFGLPDVQSDDVWANPERDRLWLLSRGTTPVADLARGTRRARALSVFLMALPGSLYLFQGEELGLPEVADLPDQARQDPLFFRSGGETVGRDGCRVPLPWSLDAPSYGFGAGGAHLPQPDWFAQYAASVQAGDPDSTLTLYRTALAARHRLQGPEDLDWVDSPTGVLHIVRPGGWHALINFSAAAVGCDWIEPERVIVATQPVRRHVLPAEATVWLNQAES